MAKSHLSSTLYSAWGLGPSWLCTWYRSAAWQGSYHNHYKDYNKLVGHKNKNFSSKGGKGEINFFLEVQMGFKEMLFLSFNSVCAYWSFPIICPWNWSNLSNLKHHFSFKESFTKFYFWANLILTCASISENYVGHSLRYWCFQDFAT